MRIVDFGMRDYGEVLNFQQNIFETLVDASKGGEERKEYILLGEHPPVITLGRRANKSNILLSEYILNQNGIKIYHIGRGGDVTYHCPGQLIVYPIIDLSLYHLGVKDYVYLLEESVIRLISKYGVKGERIEGASGVWIGKGTNNERKICAVGIKCSRFCSMHGIALNVNADLSGFSMIHPCGFQNKGVTSIAKEINAKEINAKEIDMKEIKREFLDIFLSLILSFKEVFHFPK